MSAPSNRSRESVTTQMGVAALWPRHDERVLKSMAVVGAPTPPRFDPGFFVTVASGVFAVCLTNASRSPESLTLIFEAKGVNQR